MRIKTGLIMVIVIIGFVLVTYARNNTVTHITDNPYNRIYGKSITNMQQVDQSLDDLKVDRSFEDVPALATSKTCSKRCSTTCSKSCTTTRGCSRLCKSLTEGCGGSSSFKSSSPPSPPSPSKKLEESLEQEQLPPIPVRDFSGSKSYRVIRVVDADTVVIKIDDTETTVRLIGVDTPETVHPQKAVEAYGREASRFLTNLLKGESVYLEYELDSITDKYNQTLAYVYRAPDGLFVNLEIIRQGYGHTYTQFPFEHLNLFRYYEQRAREVGKGLWEDTSLSSPKSSELGE